jgi:glyoxylase-like metal-dependent hydrolase (beta-lactamase superfamily II)
MVEATITGVDRGRLVSDENFHLEAQTVATRSAPSPSVERVETPVYNLVIEHPAGTILWDTGSHPDAGAGHWPEALYETFEHVDAAEHPLDEALAAVGYAIDDIDVVVMSHLHIDHAGGLEHFAGRDVPVFVHAAELKHAYYSAVVEGPASGYLRADFDHDLDWRVVHGDREQHFEGIEFIRLPGHSPGLLATKIDLDGYGTVIFTGDVIDVAANYHDEHPPGPGFLRNRSDWEASLHTLQDLQRRHDAELIFGHDPDQLERILEGWS